VRYHKLFTVNSEEENLALLSIRSTDKTKDFAEFIYSSFIEKHPDCVYKHTWQQNSLLIIDDKWNVHTQGPWLDNTSKNHLRRWFT